MPIYWLAVWVRLSVHRDAEGVCFLAVGQEVHCEALFFLSFLERDLGDELGDAVEPVVMVAVVQLAVLRV